MGKSFGSLFANMDSKWLRSYERAARYGEVLELMDYSPEIDTNLKVICFPAFKGYCGRILFDLDKIKAVNSSSSSDELDAQIFYSKKEHMFTSGTICAKI